jgi:hypothetical protein
MTAGVVPTAGQQKAARAMAAFAIQGTDAGF